MRRFAISDIHGCFTTYKALLETIQFSKDDELYLLGDMIDRGPHSKAVMDDVMDMIEQGYKITPIMGNHEWMFFQSIEETIPYCWDYRRFQNWMKNGGVTTLMNFGYQREDDLKQLDKKYDAFVRNMIHYIELDNCFLVHAGFNFKEEDIFKDTQNMFWIRNWYENIIPEKVNNKIIIHGHATRRFDTLEQDIKEMKYPAINIDCGCVYDLKTGIGKLCAIDIDTRQVYFQHNIDKDPIVKKEA